MIKFEGLKSTMKLGLQKMEGRESKREKERAIERVEEGEKSCFALVCWGWGNRSGSFVLSGVTLNLRHLIMIRI